MAMVNGIEVAIFVGLLFPALIVGAVIFCFLPECQTKFSFWVRLGMAIVTGILIWQIMRVLLPYIN